MANIIGVYKITSPENKVYVGSSTNIRKRLSKHKRANNIAHRVLYESFKKYGSKNHSFEILQECIEEDLLKLERHYGLFYNVLKKETGLNCRIPKCGAKENVVSEETREKFRQNATGKIAWNKGIPQTDEVKEKLSKSLKGRKTWNKGLKFSEESKRKMSESSKGSIAWNRKIVLDTINGIFYNSISEASKLTGIKRTTLQYMLDGTFKNSTNLKTV